MVPVPRHTPFALLFTLAACGGGVASSPTQSAPNAPPVEGEPSASSALMGSSASSSATPAGPTSMPTDTHKLAIAAAACWFGGVWGDALGEAPDARKAGDEARCTEVVKQVWGAPDKTRYEQLRALDPKAVDDVVSKVGVDSAAGKELRAFAEAQREALDARRAGDKVKKDLTGGREAEKLTGDEVTAVKSLARADAMALLFKVDAGELAREAHALGVMTAMERIESSRGLPKHLKVYAMQGPINALFGVPAPAMPTDATQPLPKGAYLTYVSDAAKGAGHPVPDTATTPRDREPLAWAGVLQGINDKLRPDVDAVPKDTPLGDVLGRVVRRLEAQVNQASQPGGKPPPTSKTPAPVVSPVRSTPAPAPKPAAPAPTPAPPKGAPPAKK